MVLPYTTFFVVCVCVGVCMRGLVVLWLVAAVPHAAVATTVVGNPLTSALHADITLQYVDGNPCGSDLAALHNRDIFHTVRQYDTGMTVTPGADTNRTALCTRTPDNVDHLATLAHERYRLQFSIGGVDAIFTETVTSTMQQKNINLRMMGVLTAQPVFDSGAPLALSSVHFSMFGACYAGECTVARVEVIPTYVARNTLNLFTYSSSWREVSDVLAERLQDVLHRDDEANVAVVSLIMSISAIVAGTACIVLGIRRRLLPFLREGSTLWAAVPWMVWKSLAARTALNAMDVEESEMLLTGVDDADTTEHSYEEGAWRLYSCDVLRKPAYVCTLASIVGAGSYIGGILSIIILFALCSVMSSWNGIIIGGLVASVLATPLGGYMTTSVLIGFRHTVEEGQTPTRVPAFVAVYALPASCWVIMLCINVRRMINDASGTLQLAPVAVASLLWYGCAYVGTVWGIRTAYSFAPLPAMRVNKIARPCSPVPLSARVVVLIVGAVTYIGCAVPFFWIVNASWGSRATTGAVLVVVTGVVGLAVTMTGATLLAFLLLNAGHWAWPWNIVAATGSVGVYAFVGGFVYVLLIHGMSIETIISFTTQMLPLCVALGCVCAACGWAAANTFIRSIYMGAKYD
jgi:hypothetical protein